MPVIDSRLGIEFGGGKPARICQWRGCPLSDYTGRKMKICAQCTLVRYCSKDCQRLDWKFHKSICRIPPIMDIGEWMETYKWLFKWAAMEAFEVHTDPTKILDNILLVDVITEEQIVGPMPSSFFVDSARVVGTDHVVKLLGGRTSMNSDRESSMEIRQKGGIGQALVLFICSPRENSSSGGTICQMQRYCLDEKPLGKSSGYRHFAQWEGVLKGVANGLIAVSDISRMIESPPTVTEELESQFESMEL